MSTIVIVMLQFYSYVDVEINLIGSYGYDC
jgi:hypothetical protein